ncbi:MAG: hypothetical protein ACRC7N_09290 [Clostridium sp.]
MGNEIQKYRGYINILKFNKGTILKSEYINLKAPFITYVDKFDELDESEYWYVVRDRVIDLDEFKSKKKYQIKKSLELCFTEKVSGEYIKDNCYNIYVKSFGRYTNNSCIVSEKEFKDEKDRLMKDDEREFWIIKTKECVIGYAQVILNGGVSHITQVKFNPEYMKLSPGYSLFYTITNYYLENGAKYVSDGARSINHDTGIQAFLISKLGYRKAFCRLNIIYKGNMRWIIKFMYLFKSIINIIPGIYGVKSLIQLEKIRRSFNK